MAKFIHNILTEQGHSQADLVRKSGVSANTVSAICTDTLNGRALRAKTKVQIIRALNELEKVENKYTLANTKFKP